MPISPFNPVKSPLPTLTGRTHAPMGNAHARNKPLGNAPAYGNTPNVNGAQTAVQGAGGAAMAPRQIPQPPIDSIGPVQSPFVGPSQPVAQYPGGDAPGIAQYYRSQALNNYQSGKSDTSIFNGGAPTLYHGTKLSEVMTPEEQYYMQQRNPYTPDRMQNPLQGNVPLAAPMTPQQRTNAAIQGMDSSFQQDQNFLNNTPIQSGSLEASRISRSMTRQSPFQARAANGYVGQAQVPQPFDEDAARARALETMRGGAAADPTNLAGRQGTFGAPGLAQRFADDRRAAADAHREQVMASPEYQQRMGDLKAQQDARNADPAYQARMAEAAKEREDRNQAFQDKHGTTPAKLRRFEKEKIRLTRSKDKGFMGQDEFDIKLGATERQYLNQKPIKPRKDAAAADPDRIRLPNGQLPEVTRAGAARTAENITNPAYKAPSPEFQKQAEIVQSMGLTADMDAHNAGTVITQSPIPEDPAAQKEYVRALRKYWGSMRDKDSDWSKDSESPAVNALNELAELPDDKVDNWLEQKWKKVWGEGQNREHNARWNSMQFIPMN